MVLQFPLNLEVVIEFLPVGHRLTRNRGRRRVLARGQHDRSPGKHQNPEDREVSMVTLINVFTVEPANQQRLIDLLTRATEAAVTRAPGFLSSILHRSLDGAKVTMVAHWRSAADYQAMRQDPAPHRYLEEALTIATFEPGLYDEVRRFTPAAE
jgi:quinol monooxygenase YgiN